MPDDQRDAAAVQEPQQEIATELVGAEGMGERGRREPVVEIHQRRVLSGERGQDGRCQRGGAEEQQYRRAQQRRPVAAKPPPVEPAQSAHR